MNPYEWREYNGGFAIDFGESTLKMAYYDNKGSHLIKFNSKTIQNGHENNENNSLPSNICLEMNDEKTIFGKLLHLVDDDDQWRVMDQFKEKFDQSMDHDTVIGLMSQLIRYGIEIAQNQMQNKITMSVVGQSITCLNRREYWKDPFRKAGISVQRTILEPVAACLNFQSEARGNIIVIDWGHELKISNILEEESIFEIVNSYGDISLGGYSITMEMVRLCSDKLKKTSNQFEISNEQMKMLFYKCDQAKKLLSKGLDKCDVSFMGENVSFTSDELNQIYEEKLSHIPQILRKMKINSVIDCVILCGGSMYSSYLNDKIRLLFEKNVKILSSSAPDEIIIRGIAQQAQYLNNPRLENCLVSYTLPLSIGVDSDLRKMLSIVPRNTWYSVSREAELLRSVVNGQVTLNFFEGEYDNVIDNVWLGQISFKDLNLENGSTVNVSIRMSVDDDCNILIDAQINDQLRSVVLTKYNRTLSKVEVLKMIEDSYSLGVRLPLISKQSTDFQFVQQETRNKGKPQFNIKIEDVD